MAIFLAGNRQIDRTLLENVLVLGINPYIETYQGVWGDKNTLAVKNAYSLLINAIHEDKVSMNIDGTLHINDGSIINSPDKNGFDPVAKAAYFITDIINGIPDYKEPKAKEDPKKTYKTDTFALNFYSYLAPPGSQVNIGNTWANLDDEVEDSEGNRTRPYENRLAAFNQFLDSELANLDSYTDIDEYWGDKESLRSRLLDLKQRVSDGDLSKDDLLQLSRMGFNPLYFDTTGTPRTEEELAQFNEEKAKREAEEKQAEADRIAKIKANLGVLSKVTGVYGTNAARTPEAYEKYLADTYGIGLEGFNAVNAQIQALLDKAYTDNNLSQAEKIQLGNFIHYIRTKNPAYANQILDPKERAELKTHKTFVNLQVFRLPWRTYDNRYIYSDNAGNVYFLKPANGVLFDNYATTDNAYKNQFLYNSDSDVAKAQRLKVAGQRVVSDGLTTEDILRFTAIGEDIGAFVSSFLPGYGTAGAGILGLGSMITNAIADKLDPSVSSAEWWKNLGLNLGAGVMGLVPGGKSASIIQKVLHYAPRVWGLITSGAIAVDPEVHNSFKKLLSQGENAKLTVEDWKNIGAGFTALATTAMVGNSAAKNRYYKALRGKTEVEVKTKTTVGDNTKETSHRISQAEREQINKAGKRGGQEAADAKLQEILKKKNPNLEGEVKLGEGKFAETAPSRSARVLNSVLRTNSPVKGKIVAAENSHPRAVEFAEKNEQVKQRHPILAKFLNTNYDIAVNNETPINYRLLTKHLPKIEEAETAAKPATEKPATGEAAAAAEVKESPREVIKELNKLRETPTTTPIKNGSYEIGGQTLSVSDGSASNSKVIKYGNVEKVIPATSDGKINESQIKKEILKLLDERRRDLRSARRSKSSTTKMNIKVKDLLKLKELGFLKLGGTIQKYQGGGGVSYAPDTSWYTHVFSPNYEHLYKALLARKNTYATWVNRMQSRHAGLMRNAGDNYLTTPWRDPSVGSYQAEFMDDPYAEEKIDLGYNHGIDYAVQNNRYVIGSLNPNSGDWQKLRYTPDDLLSGITADRTILGKLGDYTPEQLELIQKQLGELGYWMYDDPDDSNYYKLGYLDSAGNKYKFTSLEPTPDLAAENIRGIKGISVLEGITNPKLPDGKIQIKKGPNEVVPEGTEYNPFKVDTVGEILKGLLHGLKTGLMLSNIYATNKNLLELLRGLNLFRPYDYALQYHQVMDDYVGNLFANNLAAQLRNRLAPRFADARLDLADALDREIRAGGLERQLAVNNQRVILQHTDIAEKMANLNLEARVENANRNSKEMFNIALQKSRGRREATGANQLSINAYLGDYINQFQQKINDREELSNAWKANRLGLRNQWIQNKMNTDVQLGRLIEEYGNKDNTPERTLELIGLIRQRLRQIMYEAGVQWDQLYAEMYDLPYYSYTNPYEAWKATRVATPIYKPNYYKKGGKLSKNDDDILEREKLRIMKANGDRFMKSVWKAIDLYMHQIKSK